MSKFIEDTSLVRGVVETFKDQLDNYDDFIEAINKGNIQAKDYDTYYYQTRLVKDKSVQYELRIARLKQLIMNYTLDIKYMQDEMDDHLTDNREYFHNKGVFTDLMNISDKIMEQRYDYDIDKTLAEVKEILNRDDSDQSYELIEIVDKRVSRDLVKKYSFELFDYK
jgi:hypothetical protein